MFCYVSVFNILMNMYEVFFPTVFNENLKKNRAMKFYGVLVVLKPFINIALIVWTDNIQSPAGRDLNHLTISNLDNIDEGFYY